MGRGESSISESVVGPDGNRYRHGRHRPITAAVVSTTTATDQVADAVPSSEWHTSIGLEHRSCADILAALADLDGTLPLYIQHVHDDRTLNGAKRLTGSEKVRIWTGDVHLYLQTYGVPDPELSTLDGLRSLLAKTPELGLWVKWGLSNDTIVGYQMFARPDGSQLLSLICVY